MPVSMEFPPRVFCSLLFHRSEIDEFYGARFIEDCPRRETNFIPLGGGTLQRWRAYLRARLFPLPSGGHDEG
jgi:hypothetical protein